MTTRVVALDLIAHNRQSAVFAKVARDANTTAARRQVEAKIAAALDAAQAAVGSGVQVYTAGAGPTDVETAALAFGGVRRRRPASVVIDASIAADVADLDLQRVAFRGLTFAISPDIGHAAAADPAVYLLDGRGAARTFTSPLLQFRSFEQAGPEKIIVALWGYFAVAVIQPRGLAAIQWAT